MIDPQALAIYLAQYGIGQTSPQTTPPTSPTPQPLPQSQPPMQHLTPAIPDYQPQHSLPPTLPQSAPQTPHAPPTPLPEYGAGQAQWPLNSLPQMPTENPNPATVEHTQSTPQSQPPTPQQLPGQMPTPPQPLPNETPLPQPGTMAPHRAGSSGTQTAFPNPGALTMPASAIQAIALDQAQRLEAQQRIQAENARAFDGLAGGFHTPAPIAPAQQLGAGETLDTMSAEQIAAWAQAEAGRVSGPGRFIP